MENPDLMFCQHKTAHLLDSKCSMKACWPPHHTPAGLQCLLSIIWGGQWLCTWIICKKRKEDMWLLAAFSSVTGLDRPAVWQWGPAWQSQGWPTPGHATEQASKPWSCARIVPLPLAETPNSGYATHGVTPRERGWDRGLLAGLVKGCTIHPECKNKQRWSTQ